MVAFGGYAQAIIYGMLAFSPLGEAGMAYGIYAGLTSAIIGAGIGTLFGKAPVQFGGPRSSTALIIAGSLIGFLQTTNNHAELFVLIGIEIIVAGLFVLFAQRQGMGRLMQFLPAPVLIGLNTTLGIFSAYKLLPAIVGFTVYTTARQALGQPDGFSWAALGISSITIGTLVYFRAIRPNSLGLFYGLIAGFIAHAVLLYAWPGDLAIQTVSSTPSHPFWNGEYNAGNAFIQVGNLLIAQPALILQILTASIVLALMIVLESMQSMIQVDQTLGTRHNTRLELNTVAAANILCGFCLALPSSNYFSRSSSALGVGASTRRSEAWYLGLFIALIVVSWPVLELLPLNILATAVAISSLFLIQGRTLQITKQFLVPKQRKLMAPNDRFTVWVVFTMNIVTGLSNLLIGTLMGVLFVGAYFLRQQSSSGLRSIEFNPAVRSRSMRPRAVRQQLDKAFEHLAWVRFEGNLFFGNAPAIAIRLQDELGSTQSVVLDFSHLRHIDDTACNCIERMVTQSFKHTSTVAVLPHTQQPIGGEALLRNSLNNLGTAIHQSIDDAFWQIENSLLAITTQHAVHTDTLETLKNSHLCDHMNDVQLNKFLSYWHAVDLGSSEVLFEQGASLCGLYVLHRGQLSAWHQTANGAERLMRFCPGSVVGEMALIDRKPRSATIRTDTACTLLFLPIEQYDKLMDQELQMAQIIQNNLARELALRIRMANQSISLIN